MKILKWSTYVIMCLFCSLMFGQYNYGEALQKSLFFYEAQQSGPLPDWNRVSWRGDSALNDGSDVGHDLTGGWYDAGDHVKFNFPMASSVTALAWGAIEFEEAYARSGQLSILKRNLRFVTDYFIKCHVAPNELYGQVGNGSDDHAFWGSAEVLPMARPAYKIDAAHPGSDLAGETAAAMAAVSMLFQDDDPAYSATLLTHAKQLYSFADTYRGMYSDAITDAAGFYSSFTGYQDEIVWGALWLYRATGDVSYLEKAESEYAAMIAVPVDRVHSYSWDNKTYGSFVLLSVLTGKELYKLKAQDHLDYWTVGSATGQVTYSPGGQAWEFQWGSLRHSGNTSFLALVYSDKVALSSALKTRYHDFAVRQINYALGDNPINRSFLIGYGNNPANNPHHRTAHGAWSNSLQADPVVASHTLYGALVGGPGSPNDQFEDDRGDYQANEVACDYNACFTGALARLYGEFGGDPLPNFPVVETPTRTEIRTFSEMTNVTANGSRHKINVQNRSAWPARSLSKVSFRYFFNISEGVAAGFSIADYKVRTDYSQGPSSFEIKVWDADQHIYYVDVSLDGDVISPISNTEFKREVQLSFQTDTGAPYDVTNDFSAQGLTATASESSNIPVYENGVLIFGTDPSGATAVGLATTTFDALGLNVFPNPVAAVVNISGTSKLGGAVVKLVSLTGAVLKSALMTNETTYTMDLHDVASGAYLLTLETLEGKLSFQKIIKN